MNGTMVEVQSKFMFRRSGAWSSALAGRFKLATDARKRGQRGNEDFLRDCHSLDPLRRSSSATRSGRDKRAASTSVSISSSTGWNERCSK